MKSIAEIAGAALLFTVLLAPIAEAQERATESLCEGPYKGIRLTQQQLQKIVGSPNPADKNFCGTDLSAADLRRANLTKVDLTEARLMRANLREANLREARLNVADLNAADLTGANLSNAYLIRANLTGANLTGANLTGANLIAANLSKADLGVANLSKAYLSAANLSEAYLVHANLSKADLSVANLSGANLHAANLSGANFEPQSPPDAHGMAFAQGLSDMTYNSTPTALVTVREAFKKAGLREQERQVTYAIKRTEAAHANWIERGFNLVLFDLTSQYGMSPGRPLRILSSLIFVFMLPYAIALKRQSGDGIWMIWSKERVLTTEGTDVPIRITRRGFRFLWTAFYFSLLSAFNIGWREINIGNWISRLQTHEYTMRATGWVRTVSGIQSLISVYLVALWVLTYFGRPFE